MPEIDLRTMPPAERHPAVYAALHALEPGEVLTLINDHKPSPLRYELEATRPGEFEWVDTKDGPDVWAAEITCLARIIDVRPVIARGEEPFDLIMSAVNGLEPGQVLVVIAPFEPVPLEGVLSSQGFDYEAAEIGDGDWRVSFTPQS